MGNAEKIDRPHPPLARDGLGNLLAIPVGTTAWRICRETSGRPSELKGADKQVIRFPLDTTSDDLVELCGQGTYRVYALDELGKQLAHVTSCDLTGGRELRNSAAESTALAALRPSPSSASTDLRFALEAMTQMMRTHTEALRIVAESHVDLAKAVVASKNLPRNASGLRLLPPASTADDDDDELDDEDDHQPHWVELLMPLAHKAAEMVPGLVMSRAAAPRLAPGNDNAQADSDLASRPNWEARDLLDLQYASRKSRAKRAAREQSPTAALQARVMGDPLLMQHLFAVKAQLSADETDVLMSAIACTSEDEGSKVLTHIKALPLDGAVEFCRELVRTIRENAETSEPKS